MRLKTTFLLFLFSLFGFQASAQCNGARFEEKNGIVVIEMESSSPPSQWKKEKNVSGYTGSSYIAWRGSDSFGTPGKGTINYKVKINSPGIYRFQWRSKVGIGNDASEHNDSWLRIPDAYDFFAQSGSNYKYPKGGKFIKSNKVVNGSSANGWMKIYNSGGTSKFNWTSFTSDREGYKVYAEFKSSGVYTIQVSGRSKGHFIDRMVLYKESKYSSSSATSTSRSETTCGSGGGDPCDDFQVTLKSFSSVDVNSSAFTLSGGSPSGGTYSGKGVSNGKFDPGTAGVGTHSITYTYTDSSKNCTDSATKSITVTQESSGPAPEISNFQIVNADTDKIIGTISNGSTYDLEELKDPSFSIIANVNGNAGSVRLQLSGPKSASRTENVAPYTLYGDKAGDYYGNKWVEGTYTINATPYTGSNLSGTKGEPLALSFSIKKGGTVDCSNLTVSLNSFKDVTESTDPFKLSGGSPTGGSYSGKGVSNGTFNPVTAGIGTHTITYSYTDPDTDCSKSASKTIKVVEDVTGGEGPILSSFTLIDSGSDKDITTITNGQEFQIDQLPNKIAIRANPDANSNVGSVALSISGPINSSRTESVAPFALFGDSSGNYYGRTLSIGSYTLSATPYSEKSKQGDKGETLSISFKVVEKTTPEPSTVTVSLIDANNNNVIQTITEGSSVINGNQVNISASSSKSGIASAKLSLTGATPGNRTENAAPYALFGDRSGDYYSVDLAPGNYTFNVKFYSGRSGGGSLVDQATINFSVGASVSRTAATGLKVFPNPTSDGNVTITLAEGTRGPISYTLINSSGAILDSGNGTIVKGQKNMAYSLPKNSQNNTGVYYLIIVSNTGKHTASIIKQ